MMAAWRGVTRRNGSRPLLSLFSAFSGAPVRERVSPLRRLLTVPVVVLSALAGAGPFVDAESFTSPVFDALRDVASLEVWGSLFMLVAAIAAVALVTADLRAYTAAHLGLSFLSGAWLLVLGYARFELGIDLSLTAFGLWLFPVLYSFIVLLVPITTYRAGETSDRDRG